MAFMEYFLHGLVFAFDVGTSSIGYAVRKGKRFLEVGVEQCPPAVQNLKDRREHRRMRRTLRSRKNRLKLLQAILAEIGLPRPAVLSSDPVALRLRASRGESLSPEELHTAVYHLLRRRGYSEVPWATHDRKEEGEIQKESTSLKNTLQAHNHNLPCEYLEYLKKQKSKQRKQHWPRDLLVKEFRAICEAQKRRYPKLFQNADRILYGDVHIMSRNGETYHVYFKAQDGENAGVFALRYPRFNNRSPGLDAYRPYDEEGRPLHVARKNPKNDADESADENKTKGIALQAQFVFWMMSCRVRDCVSRSTITPPPELKQSIIAAWKKKGKVPTEKQIEKMIGDYNNVHRDAPISYIKGVTTPGLAKGRAGYSKPSLHMLCDKIEAGETVIIPQPYLKLPGEKREQAIPRLISGIPSPLVRDRLERFNAILGRLVKEHGPPSLVIVEAVRELAYGKKKTAKLDEIRRKNEDERRGAIENGYRSKNEILRYRLWKEAGGRCPYCLQAIGQSSLGTEAEIEHIVPEKRSLSNEWTNLTVAHISCNKGKGNRTPYEAYGQDDRWPLLTKFAGEHFSPSKRDIFLSSNADDLIIQRRTLAQTAYIAKELRKITLVSLGWLDPEGRDPSSQKGFYSYQVTNGAITAALRQEWGLNAVLYKVGKGKSEEEREKLAIKNRSDIRHHALDAMVISATIPWEGAAAAMALRGEKWVSSVLRNPLGIDYKLARGLMDSVKIRFHKGSGRHAQHYDTTLLAEKTTQGGKKVYIARKALNGMKPSRLDDVYPADLAEYLQAAWSLYAKEERIDGAVKNLPEKFIKKLCFSHFQRWKYKGKPKFSWARKIIIPINSVKCIAAKSADTVFPLRREKNKGPFVERKDFKEVRVYLKDDGQYEIVHIPHNHRDPLYPRRLPSGQIKGIYRKGDTVSLQQPPAEGAPSGDYRIEKVSQTQVTLSPVFLDLKALRDKKEAVAWNISPRGCSPRWNQFLNLVGIKNQ